MKNNSTSSNLSRRTRRIAALLCAALAGLGLARGAAAQQPQAGSPAQPTPYQSPLFHSGGSDPATASTAPLFGVDPALLNPLYNQLQGTPTEFVLGTGVNATSYFPVQIPSFLLGNYSPANPPGLPNIYYPNHFADGSSPEPFAWQAPFDFVALSTGMVQVDDSAAAPTPASGAVPGTSGFVYGPAGNWQQQTAGPAAGTATVGEYERLPPNTNGTAIWTLVATSAGSFSVYFHIPDQVEDGSNPPIVEPRSTQVTYQIAISGANALNTTATVSQTEANSLQFLGGPFLLAVGDTVTVTLQRDNTHNRNTETVVAPATTGSYLIADSMTLQTAVGDVRCAPAVVNTSAYPTDFARAKYWGVFVTPPAGSLAPVQAGGLGVQSSLPDTTGGITPGGANLYFYGDPAKTRNDAGVSDGPFVNGPNVTPHKRLIRQLVYFGRQDPTFSTGDTVDDSSGLPTPTTPGFSTANGFNAQVTDQTGTAINGEYKTSPPFGAGNAVPTATWTLVAPNPGQFYVTVHLPETPPTPPLPAQKRITDARYFVSVNGTAVTTQPVNGFIISQAQTGDVTLPTGGLTLVKGDRVTVSLPALTALTPANSYTIVADAVRIATSGNGTGAIYCVDGLTGSVVWRFETPGGLNGPSAPVFSSPLVTKINVLVTPATATAPAVYANKLVVIVGDDNGMVYCLDAIGNGDGTSNSNAIDSTSGLPIYIPQPAYGAAPPLQVDAAGYVPHVGTTGAYWIYRPDPNRPKYVTVGNIGTVKPAAAFDVNSDLPVPAAFSTASPNVFIDPNVSTVPDVTTGALASNAKIYIGNSNGVLYALDALGVAIDGTSLATYNSGPNSGDRFNASYDLRAVPTVFPAVATDAIVPTPQPLWWFTLRGADPDSTTNTSSADIESAPAIHTTLTVTSTSGGVGLPTMNTYSYAPTVYIGSAHEMEATSNVGRIYALDGTLGPAGNNGTTFPSAPVGQPNPAPGSFNYNIGQRPQTSATDTLDWSFPDAYNTVKGGRNTSSNKLPRPALGNITGSPVVFTDSPNQPATSTTRTRIYFAANSGLEVPYTSAKGTVAATRPDETETGRIWAVELTGVGVPMGVNTVWSYPMANDPNNAALDTTPEPGPPVGAFLRATPAMGFVRFPSVINNGDGNPYTHSDSVVNDVKGASVPMLYVATRGVNDTALYAIDIHGADDATSVIFRQPSPDGSIFQSSPVLITNTSLSLSPPGDSGGNGGSVYVVGGNTLYDFGATPTSNPGITDINTGLPETFPLFRLNRSFSGFGPISSPAVAAFDTTDLFTTAELNAFTATTSYKNTMTDWVYVGDSTSGFCRGISPYDTSDNGIPSALNTIVPPSADSPGVVDLQAIMQVYLVNNDAASSSSRSAASPPALAVRPDAPLPVYDWGQSVYIRFKNVVPPADAAGNVNYVFDSGNTTTASPANPVQVYGNGGPIEFDLSDSTVETPTTATGAAAAAATLTAADHGTVPATLLTTANTPLNNGFYQRGDTTTSADGVLVNLPSPTNNSANGYIGAYTYAISDGTARRNTPGSRRHISNARQTVAVYSFEGTFPPKQTGTAVIAVQTTAGNVVSTPTGGTPPYRLVAVQPVDEPVFGILNPLAVRAGGIPLPLTGAQTNAVPIGDELGPFRSVASPLVANPDAYDLEALTNGNAVLVNPPTSTSGGGIDPTRRNLALTNPPTSPHIVITSTGLIPHNTSGDNFDATATNFLPTGSGVGSPSTPNTGLSANNFGTPAMPFAMDIADRSALGVRLNRLRVKTGTISGGGAGLYWNDNSIYNSALPNAIATPGHDHDSVVNYLPWEMPPPAGRYENGSINSSIDYPNIGTSDVSATLYPYSGGSADLTLGNAVAKPAFSASGGTMVSDRQVYTNPVQFHISIPHYQPANQQLYTTSGQANTLGYSRYNPAGEIPPNSLTTGVNDTFPMGYVTTRRIYIPDQTGFYRPGAAYRDVRVYTGVPPDYSTQMGDSTVEVGSVPSGFGIQTSKFTGLSDNINNTTTFDPFNLAFQDYYRPLKISNTGNVNLLNVHLDQKQNTPTNPQQALSLVSDALDSTSFIPGYDYNAVTGPRSGMFGNIPEESYLIRSSLDSDLVAAYGHNPAILNGTNYAGTSLLSIYPGATFHKAQVGSGQPTLLYVPDSPEGYTPGATLDVPPTNHPTHITDPNNLDANRNQLPFKTAPFVSVAVPFGTPVGSYHASVQLFEGLDPYNYSTVVTTGPANLRGAYTGLTAQIFPPQYGGAVGGIGTPAPGPNGLPLDTIQIASNGSSSVSLMPNSSTVAVLNVKVLEDRMTDGFTYGGVPMIDLFGAGPKDAGNNPTSAPDFAPAAFRDPTSGDLSVYWTSGRPLAGSTSPFNLLSANVPFVLPPANSPQSGYFIPSDPTQYWWKPSAALAPGFGTSSGLSIAQDSLNLNNIAAFAVNVQAPSSTVPYQNTLLYYKVTPKNGVLGSSQPITNDPSQVKYGVKGLFTDNSFNSAPSLWAFWTATTRGRTAIYYNSQDPKSGLWVPVAGSNTPPTLGLLPIPAGLTAVADAAPMLMFGNVAIPNGYQGEQTIEVTYSGTAPDGKVNLYQSRYQPDGTPGNPKPYQLDLLPYPAVTEVLAQTGQAGGWYQARDVAWSRTSQFNMFVNGIPILYNAANQPQFSKAIFDKASGLLVLTGVLNPTLSTSPTTVYAFGTTGAAVTAYVDLATGRVRFSAAPNTTLTLTALFSPLARRITTASQADTGPVTFLDGTLKASPTGYVKADRRWYIWRKSGTGGAAASATIYYKTQRLTAFLKYPIDFTKPYSITINGIPYTPGVDGYNTSTGGRLFFPIATGTQTCPEGQTYTVSYTDTNGNPQIWPAPTTTDTVEWQDEIRANDSPASPTSATAALAAVNQGYALPIAGPVNENNVAAFLDTDAYFNTPTDLSHPHKVWLFWNSTRNGTADVYYETINPLFTAGVGSLTPTPRIGYARGYANLCRHGHRDQLRSARRGRGQAQPDLDDAGLPEAGGPTRRGGIRSGPCQGQDGQG